MKFWAANQEMGRNVRSGSGRWVRGRLRDAAGGPGDSGSKGSNATGSLAGAARYGTAPDCFDGPAAMLRQPQLGRGVF